MRRKQIIHRSLQGLFILLLALSFTACNTYKPWYNKEVRKTWSQSEPKEEDPYFSLFLVGDCGKAGPEGNAPIMANLTREINEAKAGDQTGIVFLGDNIYHNGLHDKEDEAQRAHDEEALIPQLDVIKNTPAQGIIVPGNHDWDSGGEEGLNYVKNQEKFVKKYLDDKHVFYPKDGCPGPEPVFLGKDIMVLAIDTQWWIHTYEKPNNEYDCAVKVNADLIKMIEDEIKANQDKKIIVVGHHPMHTYGEHGGRFDLETHLFPLTWVMDKAYVPMPVIGSIHPILRKYWGHEQDTRHPAYQSMIDELTEVFEKYPNLTYASGHDHNLQYWPVNEQHYIVSGSGAKSNYVGHGKKANFTSRKKGFARMDFFENGEVWVEFRDAQVEGKTELLYREKLYTASPSTDQNVDFPAVDYAGQEVKLAMDSLYGEHGGLHKALLGKNFREEWATTVSVPVIDIWDAENGYEIIKRGGGMQTRSLRMEDREGREFSMRSIKKYPEFAVPEMLRGTVGAAVVEDGVSASHPFAALAVPPLAMAANVYHANPTMVYLPDDPRLGDFQEDFGGQAYLIEERPAGDRSDVPTFGRSKKMLSTFKMMEEVRASHKHQVDDQWTVKSRLFDMWIGDWDRHDDQWRWGAYKVDGKTLYRPVPRDRDQAFFTIDGIIAWVSIRPYGIRNLHSYDKKVRDEIGYANNSRFFDRSFTVEADWDDWQLAIDSLQANLTDETIEQAIALWPEEIYQLHGEEVIAKLKYRRDHMEDWGRRFYDGLAHTVEVLGTDTRDLFKVERKENGNTLVQVYKLGKKGKAKDLTFEREFLPKETKEIRLYGLGGKDQFELTGNTKKGHRVRIIGGPGKDEIKDESKVSGPAKKTKVYDKQKSTEMEGKEVKNLTSNKKTVNAYERKSFKFNYFAPLITGGFNPDDGVLIGPGFTATTHGFRKEPYSTKQTAGFSYAFATQSFNFTYEGIFKQVVWGWDLNANFDWRSPNYVNNFFGFGNESEYDETQDLDYYRVRYRQGTASILLQKSDKEDQFRFGLGVEYDQGEVDRELAEPTAEPRFITQFDDNGLDSASVLAVRRYVGPVARLTFDNRDNKILPTRGLTLDAGGTWKAAIDEDADNYGRFHYDLAFYFTPNYRKPLQTTVAVRVGGGHNIGDFPFFRAQELGGPTNFGTATNLRGYRRSRFSGRNLFFQNTELRIKLAEVKTPIFPFSVGIVGLNDVGRIWQEGENSTKWHWGYGGGVFLVPFDIINIVSTYSFSEESPKGILNIAVGFQF